MKRVLLTGASGSPERWHIVGDKEINNLDMAKMVADIMGKQLNFELVDFHSSRPGHDLKYGMSGEKIKSTGWTAPIDINKSLEKTVKWYRKNPEWLTIQLL